MRWVFSALGLFLNLLGAALLRPLFYSLTSVQRNYAVVRELLVGGGLSNASLHDLAASLSLSEDDMQMLQSYVRADPVLSAEEGGGVLRALTQELHRQTWFLMHDDDTLIQTKRGTRPRE